MIDWKQLLATILSNAVLLAILGFLAKSFIERSLDRNLEKYKAELELGKFEHETKFALLHEKQAAVIAELYRLIVELLRSVQRSAQGIHQYADDQVTTPRKVRRALSVQFFNEAVRNFRSFEGYVEENRIYLSDQLLEKINELRGQLVDIFSDLETSHAPSPPSHEGLPPSIKAIWNAQKKIRLLVEPMRQEIETEFRRILGVIDDDVKDHQ